MDSRGPLQMHNNLQIAMIFVIIVIFIYDFCDFVISTFLIIFVISTFLFDFHIFGKNCRKIFQEFQGFPYGSARWEGAALDNSNCSW